MNRILNKIGLLLAGAAFFALSSCEEGTLEGLKIDLSTRSVTIPSVGGTASVSADIPLAWKVSLSGDWFEVSPRSGDTGTVELVFSARENATGQTRTGTATVSADGIEKSETITVSQPSVEVTPPVPDTELAVSPERLSFGPEAGTLTLGITANKDWKVSADNSWVTLDRSSGNGNAEVSVSVSKNGSTSSRSAVITVVSEEKTATVSVVQEGSKPDGVGGIGGDVNDWGDGNDLGFEGNN